MRHAAALALALLPATASAQSLASMSKGWTFDEQGGAALYAHVCAGCHQPDGRGAAGAAGYPALAGDANLASPDYIEILLLEGRGAMPPLGSMMSDAQIADVVNYVRTRFGNGYSSKVNAADVKAARSRAKP